MSKAKVNFKLKTKLYFISIGMVILFSAAVLFQFEKGISEQKQATIDGFNLYFENLSRIQFEADVVEKFKRNNVEMKMN